MHRALTLKWFRFCANGVCGCDQDFPLSLDLAISSLPLSWPPSFLLSPSLPKTCSDLWLNVRECSGKWGQLGSRQIRAQIPAQLFLGSSPR